MRVLETHDPVFGDGQLAISAAMRSSERWPVKKSEEETMTTTTTGERSCFGDCPVAVSSRMGPPNDGKRTEKTITMTCEGSDLGRLIDDQFRCEAVPSNEKRRKKFWRTMRSRRKKQWTKERAEQKWTDKSC